MPPKEGHPRLQSHLIMECLLEVVSSPSVEVCKQSSKLNWMQIYSKDFPSTITNITTRMQWVSCIFFYSLCF